MSRRSPGRLFNRSLAAMAVVGLVAGACNSSASPSPSAAASQPAASAATGSAAPAASHEAVTISGANMFGMIDRVMTCQSEPPIDLLAST